MLCARDYCPLSGPVESKVGCHNGATLSVENFRAGSGASRAAPLGRSSAMELSALAEASFNGRTAKKRHK